MGEEQCHTCYRSKVIGLELHETQQELEKTQAQEKEVKGTLATLQWNFDIMEGTFVQMVEEVKRIVVRYEGIVSTTQGTRRRWS